jgi:hypothetical protein
MSTPLSPFAEAVSLGHPQSKMSHAAQPSSRMSHRSANCSADLEAPRRATLSRWRRGTRPHREWVPAQRETKSGTPIRRITCRRSTTLFVCPRRRGRATFSILSARSEALRGAGIELPKVIAAHGSPIPFLRRGSREQLFTADWGRESLPRSSSSTAGSSPFQASWLGCTSQKSNARRRNKPP